MTIPVEPSRPSDESEALMVHLSADGVATIDREPILEDKVILERAQAFHARYPAGRAILRCDPATLHGRAVRVLELLREAELSRIAVSVL